MLLAKQLQRRLPGTPIGIVQVRAAVGFWSSGFAGMLGVLLTEQLRPGMSFGINQVHTTVAGVSCCSNGTILMDLRTQIRDK